MIKKQQSPPSRSRVFWSKFVDTFFPILFITLILGVFSTAILAQQAVDSALRSNNNMLKQAVQNVEMLFNAVDSVALSICQDTETLEKIGDVFENEETVDRETRIETENFRKFVSSISNSNSYIFSVYIYVKNSYGKFITSIENGITSLNDFYDQGWYESYCMRMEEETWTEAREVQRYEFEEPLEIISRYRRVYPEGMINRGVIVENVKKSEITKMLNSLSLLDGQEIKILDENGKEIFSYTQKPEVLSEFSGGATIETRAYSRRFGWCFVSIVPRFVVYQPISWILQVLLIVTLGGLFFSAAAALIVSRRKYQHAISAIWAFEHRQPGIIPFSGKRMDEYEYFIQNMFNEYIERTNLEMTVSEQKYQLRIMEILALQSQINPHFLFNTLEVIKWESIGLTHSENVVSQMLEDLADILRYALSEPDEFVTLKEEILISKSYVKILQYRYVEKFDVQWIYNEDILGLFVPKLIFQPLIENSVYHGIKEKPGFCKIRIRIRKKGDRMEFRITDNGIGMSKERLEEVRRKLSDGDYTDSIGLYNIYKRLHLLYQDFCVLKIYSKENVGTSIFICIQGFIKEGKSNLENID